MNKVYFNEYNVLMDNIAYLPIASGLLCAYARSLKEIESNYEFMPFLFLRGKVGDIVSIYKEPSVAAFSVSMWNEQISLSVAGEVKHRFPNCLIVFGGPQVPYDAQEYFKEHNFIDISVRGDGEEVFSEILKSFLSSKDFSGIANISWRQQESGICIQNETKTSTVNDLDILPSPYLEGVFEYLFENNKTKMQFQAIIETNRGCPFNCTYCVWGKGGMNKKLRYHSKERVSDEIEWLSKHKISYIFNADSNFGINKRDLDIANILVENKKKYGYPEKFRTCFTKNSNEMIYDLANTLVKNNLEKGITLSFQSLDEDVLCNIKRQNIKVPTYKKLLGKFNKENISVYTELILGLPGENSKSWKKGIEEVLESGLKGQLFVYSCEIYPNTELAQRYYQEKFGIITKRIRLTETHGLVRKEADIQEFQDIVIGTDSMPIDEWQKEIIFSWMIMTLYSLRLGFFVLLYLFYKLKVKFIDIVEYICETCTTKKSKVLSEELEIYKKHVDTILAGGGRCVAMSSYGNVYWDMEEASFLRISEKMDDFYEDLKFLVKDFLENKGTMYNDVELEEVFKYQALRMPSHNASPKNEWMFKYNIPEYFESCLTSSPIPIVSKPQILRTNPEEYVNKNEFGRKVIIWGRKSNDILVAAEWAEKNKE